MNSTLDRLTGILEVQDDMCVNSCIAYTGPFEDLRECPHCGESRYKALGDEQEDVPENRAPRERLTSLSI